MNYHPDAVNDGSDPQMTNVSKIENVQLQLATQLSINDQNKAITRRQLDILMDIKRICDLPPDQYSIGKVRLLIHKWILNS